MFVNFIFLLYFPKIARFLNILSKTFTWPPCSHSSSRNAVRWKCPISDVLSATPKHNCNNSWLLINILRIFIATFPFEKLSFFLSSSLSNMFPTHRRRWGWSSSASGRWRRTTNGRHSNTCQSPLLACRTHSAHSRTSRTTAGSVWQAPKLWIGEAWSNKKWLQLLISEKSGIDRITDPCSECLKWSVVHHNYNKHFIIKLSFSENLRFINSAALPRFKYHSNFFVSTITFPSPSPTYAPSYQ